MCGECYTLELHPAKSCEVFSVLQYCNDVRNSWLWLLGLLAKCKPTHGLQSVVTLSRLPYKYDCSVGCKILLLEKYAK